MTLRGASPHAETRRRLAIARRRRLHAHHGGHTMPDRLTLACIGLSVAIFILATLLTLAGL